MLEYMNVKHHATLVFSRRDRIQDEVWSLSAASKGPLTPEMLQTINQNNPKYTCYDAETKSLLVTGFAFYAITEGFVEAVSKFRDKRASKEATNIKALDDYLTLRIINKQIQEEKDDDKS